MSALCCRIRPQGHATFPQRPRSAGIDSYDQIWPELAAARLLWAQSFISSTLRETEFQSQIGSQFVHNGAYGAFVRGSWPYPRVKQHQPGLYALFLTHRGVHPHYGFVLLFFIEERK